MKKLKELGVPVFTGMKVIRLDKNKDGRVIGVTALEDYKFGKEDSGKSVEIKAKDGVILAFGYLADDSVINLVYKVASYTYGPILGMFLFGLFTRRRIRDGWMPWIAVAAPVLSALVQWWAREAWDYRIGFELLVYNAAFTMIGMFLVSQRHEK